MLELRQATNQWRRQETPKAILAVARPQPIGRTWHVKRILILASAAMLGGVLVAGGFCLGNRNHNAATPAELIAPHAVAIVTPDQRREIAEAFRLHESVAGLLSWYAADESTILIAPSQNSETTRQPIAVVLRLAKAFSNAQNDATSAKTYVIVCRNNDPATIELPPSAIAKKLRLRLISTEVDGQIKLQFALGAGGSQGGPDDAFLVGRRNVDNGGQTSLGQLAMNDCCVNVDASAWTLRVE
jgi:hypothetical protein